MCIISNEFVYRQGWCWKAAGYPGQRYWPQLPREICFVGSRQAKWPQIDRSHVVFLVVCCCVCYVVVNDDERWTYKTMFINFNSSLKIHLISLICHSYNLVHLKTEHLYGGGVVQRQHLVPLARMKRSLPSRCYLVQTPGLFKDATPIRGMRSPAERIIQVGSTSKYYNVFSMNISLPEVLHNYLLWVSYNNQTVIF